MVTPIEIVLLSISLAIISGVLGTKVDVPYVQAGLPMTVLVLGAGWIVVQDAGLNGIAKTYADGVFIGVVSSLLTALIMMDGENNG